jgi:DNA modification methylase
VEFTFFSKEEISPDQIWNFAGLRYREINYATHGYHRYPAKFIPQVAARLISSFSDEGDLVVDPFMGSGTTLVEAKLHRRPSLGVDINPIAHLITQAKVTPIDPARLQRAVASLENILRRDTPPIFGSSLPSSHLSPSPSLPTSPRIDYWFPPEAKRELMLIYQAVEAISDDDLRTFFRCAFSHILKPCSWWSNKTIKPIRTLTKRIPSPINTFFKHVRYMVQGNQQFLNLLRERRAEDITAEPHCADARQLPLPDASAHLIVTSPPYLTSYEYADLHQLTMLWYGDILGAAPTKEFRRRFIGTSACSGKPINVGSQLAQTIVDALQERRPDKAREAAVYFTEMRECFLEMWRVLKRGGYACIVIGNTRLCGVEILNAQVFVEQMLSLGFELHQTILREIPRRMLPPTRDQETGKFAKATEADFLAYPHEYILILRKR